MVNLAVMINKLSTLKKNPSIKLTPSSFPPHPSPIIFLPCGQTTAGNYFFLTRGEDHRQASS